MLVRFPWVWPLGWALIIFVLSSIPGPSLPPSPISWLDKAAHAGIYAVLGALCMWGLSHWRPRGSHVHAFFISAALCTLYGATDELHQRLVPGRCSDWYDLLADALGGLVGSLAAAQLVSRASSARVNVTVPDLGDAQPHRSEAERSGSTAPNARESQL